MTTDAIEASGLSKRFGQVHAVRDATFAVGAGRVTGFLGPNGAGKSTTLRMILGLANPDAGTVLVHGRRYRDLPSPARCVGSVLDVAGAHPRMTARAHLRTYCALGGLPGERVDAVLTAVGAEAYADRRVGTLSTGMRQRLALATAILGDPDILVLDEPSNGLDPAGIAWLRDTLRDFAAAGGTVLLSSHALGQIQQVVDDVVLIDRGQVRFTGRLAGIVRAGSTLEEVFLDITREEITREGARS